MDGFLDRYNSVISQIHRETEEGMLYAQPDTTGLPPGAAPPRPSENYIHTMATYDEYGRPRPPEGHVRVMGALVKRMPTIESIGSGEAVSILSARDRMRTPSPHNSGSRPPTRANTFSSISEPPSRANSLSVAVERVAAGSPGSSSSSGGGVLGGVSEVLEEVGGNGEVSELGEVATPRLGSAGTMGTMDTGRDTNRTGSYYTAGSTMNSARSSPEAAP
ncbi:hypothetical protein EYR40_010356 [Pleurotus pulmonarius]|nr:hypothetical protein EYR36_010255 [Pleurotus pulmonarius]KAF4588801.1 hypothetical protein EYR40_010356 [Pleurotus pulmonarius]